MPLTRLKNHCCLWLICALFVGQDLNAQWETKYPETNYVTGNCNIFIQDTKTAFLLPGDGYARILRTRDRGETWEERVLPSLNCTGIDVMTSVGELNLWAGNGLGMVLHSTDGGDNWKSYYYASPVLAISFFDSLTGWILTGDQKLRHTTDGGKSWESFTCPYTNVFAVNRNTLLSGNGSTYAFVSYNKGKTWEYLGRGYSPYESPVIEIFYSEWCNLLDSYRSNQSGLFSRRERSFYNSGGKLSSLVYYINPSYGWNSFHQQNLMLISNWSNYTQLPLKLNYPGGLGFFDEKNGILVNNYTLYKTNDGGQSWQSSLVLRKKREQLTDMIFTSPQVAFMSAYRTDAGGPTTSELYKSEDGGNTWVSFYLDNSHLYAAMALLDDHLFIVGDSGTVVRIHTMSKIIQTDTVESAYLNDIVFFGAGIGLICGEKGVLYRSPDRGQTWNKIPMAETHRLFELQVIEDGKIIRMSGPQGFLLQSLDSGLTWGQLPLSESTASSLGMHFINADTGAVIGYDFSTFPPGSSLFRTYDGGLTWDKFQISMSNYMSGMAVIPYIMDETILIGTGDGIARLDPYSIDFELEYSRSFGGPAVFRKDPSGGVWAVCNWSTLLYRETMGPFSLLSPENNTVVTLDKKSKLTLEWEKVKGAYEYRVFFRNKDSVVEKTAGDFLRLDSEDTYKMFFDDVQLAHLFSEMGLDSGEGTIEWNVWAINTEDTIKLNQPRSLHYHWEKDGLSFYSLNFHFVPNPASDHVNIFFDSPVSGTLALQITDAGGKNIQTRFWEKCECGYVSVDTDHLSQGVYFVTVIQGNHRSTGKLIIAR
jgi:photosystem II stability/assembly factor-like uncharacterized protein